MNSAVYTDPPRARLRAFAVGSLILHGMVLASWQASPWMTGQANGVISVTLVSDHTGAAPAEARLTTRPTREIAHRRNSGTVEKPVETSKANHDHARAMALLAAPAKTEATSMDSRAEDLRPMEKKTTPVDDAKQDNAQDTSDPISPAAPATGEDDERGRAKAQIQARLYTDLARYFDYPYVARLRGWEGTVLLAFNIEANGRLESIRVARSSGFAVLDDSALNALRKVERLAETTAWLQGRELTMRIPVIYRLRCSDAPGCRENQRAGNDLEPVTK